ncbi:MAG: FHA domain-containing protein, partial [Chitinivibrionales bacterium]|nr:FHA domain-containing protein [Chitinivibrionales bacterium]
MMNTAVEAARRFDLDGRELTIGRDPECDIVLKGVGISRRHATITLDPSAPTIHDSGSSFGLRVNGEQVAQAVLHDGATVLIGITRFVIECDDATLALREVYDDEAGAKSGGEQVERTLSIGRDETCDLRCAHPLVSRFHASLHVSAEGGCVISDQQSTNGTFVNGRRVRRQELQHGDIVQVGPYRYFLEDDRLVQADDFNRVRIEAVGLRVRRGARNVLDGVSLSVDPGEFVAILGPSGAGKSTLAYALTGQVRPTDGEVYINAMPLQQFAAAFNSSIGFVSQHNLLPAELTVEEIFVEQSILRLPADSTAVERRRRIDEVIGLLELGGVAGKQVRMLSGGEAKRVHLGIELLASPALILLDEPLAGLDFGLIRSFMVLFRTISDRGHTVMLTTHTLEQIELCDRVLFVNNGCLVYEGTPSEMGTAFGVGSIGEVYEKVKRENITRLGAAPDRPRGGRPRATMPVVRLRRNVSASPPRQLILLVLRYLRVFSRDLRNMALVLAQMPLIVMLLTFVFRRDISFFPISFYFAVTISAIWVGGVNTIREIAREWQIVFREYRAGLSLSAYVLAKLGVFGLLTAAQGALFGWLLGVAFTEFAVDW